jgi:hypothetical protein
VSDEPFILNVGPLRVWRCTEAVDPKSGYTFRTIGNPDGRCIEIVAPRNTMLMDRRLARQMAEAVLAICGPAEELASDLAEAEIVEVMHSEEGVVIGFRPYVSRTGNPMSDAKAFVEKVRADKGLPPADLLDIAARASHG